MTDIREQRERVLAPFVTSPDAKIYALRHEVPPEVFGAFGSYFSRNPKDLREHLLDALDGRIQGQEVSADWGWLAQGGWRSPSSALGAGLRKSQDFFREVYGGYSHKSIANMVWIPFVANDVSQLFARELARDQLAFFIEQSTRYVKFDVTSVTQDPDIGKEGLGDVFDHAVAALVNTYESTLDAAVRRYRDELPFDRWKELQGEEVLRKSEKKQKALYSNQIRGKGLDVARFLLPQCIRTNIAWILDARSSEFDIALWKGHPLSEMRAAAQLFEEAAGEVAPSLLKYTERNEYYAKFQSGSDLQDLVLMSEPVPFRKSARVLSVDQDALDRVLVAVLRTCARGGSYGQRLSDVQALTFPEKIEVLRKVTEDRGKHDEWVTPGKELDGVRIAVEICTDVGAVRDWRRHQAWDRSESLYTLENGVEKPQPLIDLGSEISDSFDRAMQIALDAERRIRAKLAHQAQYVVPMAARHSWVASSGLDQLQYLLWTRSTPHANFSYRQDAFNLAEAAVRTLPWLLGYQEYPASKPFLEVYRDAPLKGVLRLQVGEEALHT
ncbi:MAG: hypothetical protein HC945_00710 [Nitrosarchaeum sp.]|nr:hypothetical protein [Nitrosarchaeum sp.]